MERILKDTTATISIIFQVDGTATDPSGPTATVEVIRANGTTIVAAGTATTRTGVGAFSYTLSTANTALLDILTVRWTSSLGTVTDTVEVVGGFLFSIAQARAVKPLEDTAAYSTQAIIDARTLAESALEDLCGVAFVPRYAREVFAGSGTSTLLLRPRTSTVRTVDVSGTAYTSTELAALVPQQTGVIYNPNTWASGYGNLTIGYEHGYATTPPRVSQACLLLAKNWLVKGPLDDRMTSVSNEGGTFALLTPGVRGSYVGIPEVDAVIGQYGLNAAVA